MPIVRHGFDAFVSGSRKVEISKEEDLQGTGKRMRMFEVSTLRASVAVVKN